MIDSGLWVEKGFSGLLPAEDAHEELAKFQVFNKIETTYRDGLLTEPSGAVVEDGCRQQSWTV